MRYQPAKIKQGQVSWEAEDQIGDSNNMQDPTTQG